jgi:IMP and pyridine-specific 5'-nucleotidase
VVFEKIIRSELAPMEMVQIDVYQIIINNDLTEISLTMSLKEQDALIDAILSDCASSSNVINVLQNYQELFDGHYNDFDNSALRLRVPSMGKMHIPLDLMKALEIWETKHATISKRQFVKPSFREIRGIINVATSISIVSDLKLITFDADDTLYDDGGVIEVDSPMVISLVRAARAGIHVSLVTAASYPGEPKLMERRILGLLKQLAFALECGASKELLSYFHVMGGESNYLYSFNAEWSESQKVFKVFLVEVPPETWKDGRGVRWNHDHLKIVLDLAQDTLVKCSQEFSLNVQIIRKERAVGLVAKPGSARIPYEILEEITLKVQDTLSKGEYAIPWTAFNGGNDVFIDIGAKSWGITALQSLLKCNVSQTVHFGDRFTSTGNDKSARESASCIWVSNPAETLEFLTMIVDAVGDIRGIGGSQDDLSVVSPSSPALNDLLSLSLRTAWDSMTGSVVKV